MEDLTNDHYVLIMRDRGYKLVGPFPTNNAAGEWGHSHWPENGDPRWQTIALDHPGAVPVLLDPSSPEAATAIKE